MVETASEIFINLFIWQRSKEHNTHKCVHTHTQAHNDWDG